MPQLEVKIDLAGVSEYPEYVAWPTRGEVECADI